MELLFSKVPIERSQIITIMGLPPDGIDLDEMSPDIASIYEAQIFDEISPQPTHPRFDLVLLGMGEDGHTCSLFPGHRLIDSDATVAWLNDSPESPSHRITLTLPVLNAAYELAFVCTGASKQKALADVLEQLPDHSRPASLVKLADGPISWFVDRSAAEICQRARSFYESGLATQNPDDEASSVRPSNVSSSLTLDSVRLDQYPYNLLVYPPMYPNLEDVAYPGPLPYIIDRSSLLITVPQTEMCNTVVEAPPHEELAVSPLGHQNDKQDLERSERVEAAPHEELAVIPLGHQNDKRDLERSEQERVTLEPKSPLSFGLPIETDSVRPAFYPFNLTIYPSVYPHLQETFYQPMPPNISSCSKNLSNATQQQAASDIVQPSQPTSVLLSQTVRANSDSLDLDIHTSIPESIEPAKCIASGVQSEPVASAFSSSVPPFFLQSQRAFDGFDRILNQELDHPDTGLEESLAEITTTDGVLELSDDSLASPKVIAYAVGYPYGLQIYPAVYPDIAYSLYPPDLQILDPAASIASHQVTSHFYMRSTSSTGSDPSLASQLSNSSSGVLHGLSLDSNSRFNYPYDLSHVYSCVYPHLDFRTYPSAAPLMRSFISIVNQTDDLHARKLAGNLQSEHTSHARLSQTSSKSPNTRSHVDNLDTQPEMDYPSKLYQLYPVLYPNIVPYPALSLAAPRPPCVQVSMRDLDIGNAPLFRPTPSSLT